MDFTKIFLVLTLASVSTIALASTSLPQDTDCLIKVGLVTFDFDSSRNLEGTTIMGNTYQETLYATANVSVRVRLQNAKSKVVDLSSGSYYLTWLSGSNHIASNRSVEEESSEMKTLKETTKGVLDGQLSLYDSCKN